MENQGKKLAQMKDSELFTYISIFIIGITLLILVLASCGTTSRIPQDDRVWIHIENDSVELVADEYDGQYLKQRIASNTYIYIPYIGVTDDQSDTLQFYNAKN